MKKMWMAAFAAVSLASMTGCLTGDEGGGGGGGGPVSFHRGFAFVRGDEIYVADEADFTSPTALTNTGNNRQPSLSADGKQVVFVHADPSGAPQIQTVATNGSGTPRTVYTADTSANQKNFRTPVFSPDGTKIVFAFDLGPGTNSRLAVVNSDGSGFGELTSSTMSFAAPVFYPDGSAVLSIAGSSANYTQIQKVSLSGKLPVTVLSSLDPQVTSITNRAALSPDGTKVAFDGHPADDATVSRIFVVDLSTGATNQLTDYPGDPTAQDSFPTWVSNTDVGFSSNTGGSDQVYVLPASATKTRGGLKVPTGSQPWFGGVAAGPTS